MLMILEKQGEWDDLNKKINSFKEDLDVIKK